MGLAAHRRPAPSPPSHRLPLLPKPPARNRRFRFDPVRAKAEGRDSGLPRPIADLFSGRLVVSEELGEVPGE